MQRGNWLVNHSIGEAGEAPRNDRYPKPMRTFMIKVETRESAQSLFEVLRRFGPALGGSSRDGYFVSVDVGGNDRRILQILDAIHEQVEKGLTLTRVELDKRAYTVRPLNT
jgi:hypothetical protein